MRIMIRTIRTLVVPLALAVAIGGCTNTTNERPATSTTQTTSAKLNVEGTPISTNAPYDPHFRVSDPIYESCQLASRQSLDVAEGTALCMKSGTMAEKRVRIRGSRDEVDMARNRLVGNGVDINRIVTVYADGPAYVEIVENTLGKPEPVRQQQAPKPH